MCAYVFTRPYRQFNTGDAAPSEYDPGVTGTLIARGVLAKAEPERINLDLRTTAGTVVVSNKAIKNSHSVKVKS